MAYAVTPYLPFGGLLPSHFLAGTGWSRIDTRFVSCWPLLLFVWAAIRRMPSGLPSRFPPLNLISLHFSGTFPFWDLSFARQSPIRPFPFGHCNPDRCAPPFCSIFPHRKDGPFFLPSCTTDRTVRSILSAFVTYICSLFLIVQFEILCPPILPFFFFLLVARRARCFQW